MDLCSLTPVNPGGEGPKRGGCGPAECCCCCCCCCCRCEKGEAPGLRESGVGEDGRVVAGAAAALLASPQTFYQQLTQSHNQYFLPSYPTLPYGSRTWSPIPLSTYSTLNGATSTSNPTANQLQQSPRPNSPTASQGSASQRAQSQSNAQSLSSQSPDSGNPQSMIIEYVLMFL